MNNVSSDVTRTLVFQKARSASLTHLPSLREAAVVPEDRTVVLPNIPLLHVLLNRVPFALRVNLHLPLAVLGDLS